MVIKKKEVNAPQVLNKPIHYASPVSFSRGMKVELEGCTFLFISGTASVDKNGRTAHPRDFLAQARKTFSNLTGLLRSEGASWHDVVKTTCYLKNMRTYSLFNEVRNKFYKQQGLTIFPASTCVEANLCRRELLVEIELIALLRANKYGRRPGLK